MIKKLQYFDLPYFFKQLTVEYLGVDDPYPQHQFVTAFMCYLALYRLGNQLQQVLGDFDSVHVGYKNIIREECTLFVEEPWVYDVFERIEEIRLNALKQAP